MRTTTFWDWFCEFLLLVIFCAIVTGYDAASSHKHTIEAMWWIAGCWLVMGLIRCIYHRIQNWGVAP